MWTLEIAKILNKGQKTLKKDIENIGKKWKLVLRMSKKKKFNENN